MAGPLKFKGGSGASTRLFALTTTPLAMPVTGGAGPNYGLWLVLGGGLLIGLGISLRRVAGKRR